MSFFFPFICYCISIFLMKLSFLPYKRSVIWFESKLLTDLEIYIKSNSRAVQTAVLFLGQGLLL